jgi:hypothetical protein
MSPKLLMFATFVFFVGSLLCCFIEGNYIGSDQTNLANSLTNYHIIEINSSGSWTFASTASGFFIKGIPKLILWDYNYFQGGYFIVRLFLIMTISVMVVWGVIQVCITIAQGIIGWIRGLL